MLARRPLLLWSLVALFGLSAASMPLAYRLLYPPIPAPKTLTELSELLSQKAPSLYVVPEIENRPEAGIYICTQPQPLERLALLARNSTVVGTSPRGRWQGVVFCEKTENHFSIEDDEFQSWGEYGMRIGPLVFFGDPTLLRRIYELIFNRSGGRRDR